MALSERLGRLPFGGFHHEATLAVKFKLTIDDIRDTVHVFPTLSEATKLVVRSFRRDITKMSCCAEYGFAKGRDNTIT